MNGVMANRKVKRLLGDSGYAWKYVDLKSHKEVHVVGKVKSDGRTTVCGEGNSYEEALERASKMRKE